VFQGTTDGYFHAYRADTGEKLWSFFTGSSILGAPSVVEIDGQQLILVAAGSGSTSAVGFATQFAGKAGGPARLLAFALNGKAHLPASRTSDEVFPKPPAPEPDLFLAKQGKVIWDNNGCELCHGFQVIGGLGSVPDLRRMNSVRYELFSQIVSNRAATSFPPPPDVYDCPSFDSHGHFRRSHERRRGCLVNSTDDRDRAGRDRGGG
jgi:quinohemoprotein ethanol dehydrogenase